MKVILQETLEGVGNLGDLLDVSPGFARNYLLPRRKAVEANNRNIKAFEHAQRVTTEKAKKERLDIEAHAKKLSSISVTIPRSSWEGREDVGSVMPSTSLTDGPEKALSRSSKDRTGATDQGTRQPPRFRSNCA